MASIPDLASHLSVPPLPMCQMDDANDFLPGSVIARIKGHIFKGI